MAASARPLRPPYSPYSSARMKRCTKCREKKPPTDFRRDRSRKDGRYPHCKACERRWRQENAETWPTITAGGRRPMWRRSERRIAGIASASAKTPTTGSEGEPGIASTARGSEPGYPIRRPRQTTAGPGPSPRCNGARKARLLRSDPQTDPLLEQRREAVACSRALSRRTRRTSPDAECSSSTRAGAAQGRIARRRTHAARPEREPAPTPRSRSQTVPLRASPGHDLTPALRKPAARCRRDHRPNRPATPEPSRC
jgi:hypothetical protein